MQPLPTLKQCLLDTEVVRLRLIARLWGLEVTAGSALDMAEELTRALADPQHAADVWQSLPEIEREALTALIEAGGRMPAAAFKRRFGEIRPMGPGRLEREAPWRNPASATEGLWYRGLLYVGFDEIENGTYPIVFVPEELQAVLPVEVEPAAEAIQVPATEPPGFASFDGDMLLHDVTTALAFVHNQVVRLQGDARTEWPERAVQSLAEQLRDANWERQVFMLHLIDALGWTRLAERDRLRLVAEPVTTWLRQSIDESRQALVRGWLAMMHWNELWRLTQLRPEATGNWHTDPTLARNAFMRHLDTLPPGQWVRIDEFCAAIKSVDPDFLRPDGDYEAWYVQDSQTGAYLKGFESWDAVEGQLLHVLLVGPARWLGLVELGGDVDDPEPDAFRVKAFTLSPPELPAPVVRPDLTVTLPADRRYERFQLARIAELEQADETFRYRITPAALERARRQHIQVEKALDFLEELSEEPLPAPVRASLLRWQERGTEAWLERKLVLRVAAETTMQQIMATSKASRHIKQLLTPTLALVEEEDWSPLVGALAEMGLLAEVEI
jgi:hypothetical protein